MSDYKKLENQPLKFVLAEFCFSPVMQIAEYIPKIQEALRKQYPTPVKQNTQSVQVQSDGITLMSADQWAFISASKKSAIYINQERLIYITVEYQRFTGFADSCRQAIDTIINIVEPTLITRIGLRYGDLAVVGEGEKISDLVSEHFGLPVCVKSLGAEQEYSTNTHMRTNMGVLAIRTMYGNHSFTCLPDVQNMPIPITADKTPSERIILDFDHYWEAKNESVSFETDVVLEKLIALHETSRSAFWKVTTDYARNKKWT